MHINLFSYIMYMDRKEFVLAVLAVLKGEIKDKFHIRALLSFFDFEPDSYGDIHQLLKNLEEEGHVETARKYYLRLTPKGQERGEKSVGLFEPEIIAYIKRLYVILKTLSACQLKRIDLPIIGSLKIYNDSKY